MKSYSSWEVLEIMKADGWYLVSTEGSHHHFKHPSKLGKATVTHPKKDIPRVTLNWLEKQTGLFFR